MAPLDNLKSSKGCDKMAYGNRKIIFYGAAGIIAAIIMIAAVLSASSIINLVNPPRTSNLGMLIVKVTDAPVPDLKNLNLTIDSVDVSNETGNWIPVPITNGTAYFDLLKLENVTRDLGTSSIPAGNYTKIRMHIVSANATKSDDGVMELNVPPGHIDISVHFEIKAEKTTSLIIDIIVDKVQIAKNGNSGNPANLNPQFKATVVPP